MTKTIKLDYDGSFAYDNKEVAYNIVDGGDYPSVNGKMGRGVVYFCNGNNIGYATVYGTTEEMTNILPSWMKKQFLNSGLAEKLDEL